MDSPIPVFTRWFPWRSTDGEAPAQLGTLLRKVGCYLLARFESDPPAGPANPAHPSVFYIGETHGSSASLAGRLGAFGNSAGFHGDQWSGHYAAWQYPHRIDNVIVGPGSHGNGYHTSSKHVYFALCTVPEDLPAHLHGLFPTAIEQQSLWLYAHENKTLPKLNNSGRRDPSAAPSMPTLSDSVLSAILACQADRSAATDAACHIAQTLARAMRYDGRVKTNAVTYGAWHGAERTLEAGSWLYLGWYEGDPTAVTLGVYRGEKAIYEGGAARTREDLVMMLQAFWYAWNA